MRMLYPRTIWLLGLLLSVVASGSAQRGDTIRVANGSPRYTGVANVVEELTIGVLEGSANYTFSFVTDIAVSRDGAMLILDAPPTGRASVRLFSPKGQFLRRVGGEGRGPGEYSQPAAVAIMPDGRFLILDPITGRINVYNETGVYSETWRVPFYPVTRGVAGNMRVDPVNGLVGIRFYISTRLGTRHDPRSPPQQAVVRIRPNGYIADTLDAPDLPNLFVGVGKIPTGRGGAHVWIPLPYIPAAIWQYSPLGYFVTGISNRYAIDVRVPRERSALPLWKPGDRILSIRRNIAPVVVLGSERADQKRHLERELASLPGIQKGKVSNIPRTKPYFKWLDVGDDGLIWVKLHVPSESYSRQQSASKDEVRWREPLILDVFEPGGVYVGRVRMPADVRTLKFAGNLIWAVVRDEFDVEYLKRYRVQWK